MTKQPKHLEALLISKAMADEAFKRELISNPKTVIARETGQELPESVEIEVLESTPKKLYLVLPLKVESEEIPTDELSDKELEAVAGGLNLAKVLDLVAGGEKEDAILSNMTHSHSSCKIPNMITHGHSSCVSGGTGSGNW